MSGIKKSGFKKTSFGKGSTKTKQPKQTSLDKNSGTYHGKGTEEEYQGWSNRETWAVRLHWDNDPVTDEVFRDSAKSFKEQDLSSTAFADHLQEEAEVMQSHVINDPDRATQEERLFTADVGSLWRVNWQEIADSYYDAT